MGSDKKAALRRQAREALADRERSSGYGLGPFMVGLFVGAAAVTQGRRFLGVAAIAPPFFPFCFGPSAAPVRRSPDPPFALGPVSFQGDMELLEPDFQS